MQLVSLHISIARYQSPDAELKMYRLAVRMVMACVVGVSVKEPMMSKVDAVIEYSLEL